MFGGHGRNYHNSHEFVILYSIFEIVNDYKIMDFCTETILFHVNLINKYLLKLHGRVLFDIFYFT